MLIKTEDDNEINNSKPYDVFTAPSENKECIF
jgi:hypothetical protein